MQSLVGDQNESADIKLTVENVMKNYDKNSEKAIENLVGTPAEFQEMTPDGAKCLTQNNEEVEKFDKVDWLYQKPI